MPYLLRNKKNKLYLSENFDWVENEDSNTKIFKTIGHVRHVKHFFENESGLSKTFSIVPTCKERLIYDRHERISIEQWHDLVLRSDGKPVSFKGKKLNTISHRYQNFIHHGTVCVGCGLEATHYWIERHKNVKNWHLNLYGVKDEVEVLFTKDHILAKANGGLDVLENYQTMCFPCNLKKGCDLLSSQLEGEVEDALNPI